MSPGTLIALIVAPCLSPVHEVPQARVTVVDACPGTVRYIYAPEFPRAPAEYARMRHLTEGPRQDRVPPEVRPAAKKKVVAKKAPKKRKGKRYRRGK